MGGRLARAYRLAEGRNATPAALVAIERRTSEVASAVRGQPDIRSHRLRGGHRLVATTGAYRLLVKLRPLLDPDLEGNDPTFFGRPAQGEFRRLVDRHGLTFSRAIVLDEDDLQRLADPVERLIPDGKGFNLLDWAGLLEVHGASGQGRELVELAIEFEQLPEVEYAAVDPVDPEPPPVDFAPETPNLLSQQSYWGPDPGIDIEYAWQLGLRGDGLTITDHEHSWGRLDHEGGNVHEDLHQQDISYGLPWRTDDYEDHGVAVMGLLLAGENGYGINGAVPEARGLVYSVVHGDTQILAAAADDLSPGDIMLLEMQRGDGGVPDIPKANWDLVKAAVDAGIVVVETAGNGGQNMDAPQYDEYNARGDNGAIRVGAGSPDRGHHALDFSTYGSSVHIQGWGYGVFTLGYGGYATYGGDPNQEYTGEFSGTSSAGPIATAAVALVQSYARDIQGKVLTSREMRDVLVDTGIPQGNGGHVGPLPDTRAAIEKLSEDSPPDEEPPTASITYPLDGDSFVAGDSFDITAEAADNLAVSEVVLIVNGVAFSPDTKAPYAWAVANIPAGGYDAHVVATDLAGNQTMSRPVAFEVEGDAGTGGDDGGGTGTDTGGDGGGDDGGDGSEGGGDDGGDGDADGDSGGQSGSGGATDPDPSQSDGGCSCRAIGRTRSWAWTGLLLAPWVRRRRGRRR